MLAPSDRYDGVGVDLEEMSRVSDEVWTYVATEPERDLLGAAGLGRRELTTALFSTKEAVFKAVHPLSDEFLEFGHVTIAFDWSAGTFTACCGAHPKSERYAQHGRGLFKVASDHVFAAFVIPAHRLCPGDASDIESPGQLRSRFAGMSISRLGHPPRLVAGLQPVICLVSAQ